MPIIYSDSQIAAHTLVLRNFTTSAGTKGLVITNYSNYVMTVDITQLASQSIIPPYSQIKIPIGAGYAWGLSAAALSAAAVIPNLTMYVDFNESGIDLEPGIISLAQLPAYNMNVSGNFTLTGTSNNVNIGTMPAVIISGTPNINITNVPSMNINSSATLPVTFAGTQNVNISNVPSVTIPGVVNVAFNGTQNVNISSSTPLTVNFAATQNVNIANVPSMNIASGTVNATIQNALLNSLVTNASISTNPVIYIGTYTRTVNNLANGAGFSFDAQGDVNAYDEFIVYMASSAGIQTYTFGDRGINSCFMNQGTGHIPANTYVPVPGPISRKKLSFGGVAGVMYATFEFDQVMICNDFAPNVINSSGANIVSDTLTIIVFGKQSTIQTSTSSPVFPGGGSLAVGGASVVLLNGNVLEILHRLVINVSNPNLTAFASNVYVVVIDALTNGNIVIIPVGGLSQNNVREPVIIDLSPGIINTGIKAYALGLTGTQTALVNLFVVK